jgi:hypothetical protein
MNNLDCNADIITIVNSNITDPFVEPSKIEDNKNEGLDDESSVITNSTSDISSTNNELVKKKRTSKPRKKK